MNQFHIYKTQPKGKLSVSKTNTKLNKKTPEYEEHLKSSKEMETSGNIGEREGQTGLQNGSILSISQTTEQDGSPNEGALFNRFKYILIRTFVFV
jgi:hypothetical protein